MPKPLIIVESPTKAKTISKFIGSGYTVESSYGHIRDLPKSKIGVDIENDYEPTYVIPETAQKRIDNLNALAENTNEIILATDEDREGEAIAWHLTKAIDMRDKKISRIVFHEITKTAIEDALKHPRSLDLNMVDAQQARRVLDRLVGYKLSPLIWKKIAFGLSAGRVQSVAVRLIVERENEIRAFNTEEYWGIEGVFYTKSQEDKFEAHLAKYKGETLDKFAYKNSEEANKVLAEIKNGKFTISDLSTKESSKSTPAPFTTSTLQQEASKKFGYPAKMTMQLAQKLYEGIALKNEGQVGLITYMRTDSKNLAQSAVESIRGYIKKELGDKYLPAEAKTYTKKQKGAQEAHEAIRPTDALRTPASIKDDLDPKMFKVYELIWERTVACQMEDARVLSTSVDIENGDYIFRANGSTIVFDGWLKIYDSAVKENILPKIEIGDKATADSLLPIQHFTEPPARYTEASLIKALEENGIGRPSTYAPTISTIETRKYINRREDKKFEPTDIGEVVNKLLVNHFPEIVDIGFTAEMEKSLDDIAEGEKKWKPVIKAFYEPFAKLLAIKDKEIDKKELTEEKTDIECELCKHPMVKKMGRFGRFLACSNYPTCKNTKPLDQDGVIQETEKTTIGCKLCGGQMVGKVGRFGKYLACENYPTCKNTESLLITTGVACPTCKEGAIVEKKSKRGKVFYACSRYPDCTQAYWNKPVTEVDAAGNITPKLCPECKSIMLQAGKSGIKCSSCDHKEKIEVEDKNT